MPTSPFCVEITRKTKHGPTRSGLLLDYETETVSSRQDATNGRTLLTPRIDLKRYRFSATVDWIEISFITPGNHQARNISDYVKRKLGFGPRVSGPIRDKDRYVGHSFFLRLQSPPPSDFWRLCDLLERQYQVRKIGRGAIRVTGVEVALDIYPKSGREEERQLMTEAVRRHILFKEYYWAEQRRWPRTYYWDGRKPVWPINRPSPSQVIEAKTECVSAQSFRDRCVDSYCQPPVDGTFYAGEKKRELVIRIQDKITDQYNKRTGSKVDLSQMERRTRVELQVGYGAFASFGAIYRRGKPFKFADIMKSEFQMLLPTIASGDGKTKSDELKVFQKAGLIGLDRFQRAMNESQGGTSKATQTPKRRSGSGSKGRALAWSEFNKRGRDELAHLDERWRRR